MSKTLTFKLDSSTIPTSLVEQTDDLDNLYRAKSVEGLVPP